MIKISCLIAIILLFLVSYTRVYSETNPKINEFMAHPTSPNKEWVEFYNPDSLNLTDYWLDDDIDFSSDSGSSAKKSLSAVNSSNSTFPYLEFDSFLNNSGDYVVLFDKSGAVVDEYQYQKDPGADVTFGRSPDGTGSISQLVSETKGSVNAQIKGEEPSPTPSPSPSQTTTTTSTKTTTKSPSPSPKPLPQPTAQTTKAPIQSSKTSPQVLSAKEVISKDATQEVSTNTSSPQPNANTPKPSSKLKIAGLLSGSGLALIGLSFILYLWYSKRLSKSEPKDDEKIF